LENNSTQPRDLTENRQSDSLNKSLLTLSHGKMKKGNVEVDEVMMGENKSAITGPCDCNSE
jgi:hypothetical protein